MCVCVCVCVCVCADIYHCVFGDLEESLQSCCYKALESARAEKVASVVFWLDGFAFLSGTVQAPPARLFKLLAMQYSAIFTSQLESFLTVCEQIIFVVLQFLLRW